MSEAKETEASEDVLRQELADEVWGNKQPVIEKEKVVEPEIEEELVNGNEEETVNEIDDEVEETENEIDPLQEKLNEISDRVGLIDKLDYRLKQAERRLGSVQNKLSEAQIAKDAAAKAPTKEQIEEQVKDDLQWEEAKDLYPEIVEGIEKKLAKVKPQEIDVKALRAELIDDLHPQIKEEITLGIQPDIVAIVHPDFKEIDASKEFGEWLPKQSEEIRQKATSAWAKDVISVISEFKSSKQKRDPKEIQDERDKRLNRAEVKKPTGRALKQKALDEMTEQEVREYYAKHYDDL